MKILVSTAMRVGSTWVGSLSKKMKREGTEKCFLDNQFDFDLNEELTSKNYEVISSFIKDGSENVYYKSHSLQPKKCKGLLERDNNLRIINVLRDYKDALESRYYYSRYHYFKRFGESDLLSVIGSNHYSLNDEDCVRYIVENSDLFHNWLLELKLFNSKLKHPNFLTLNYEKLREGNFDTFKLLYNFVEGEMNKKQLVNLIKRTTFEQESIIERRNEKDDKALFRRAGGINIGAGLFTDEIFNKIEK